MSAFMSGFSGQEGLVRAPSGDDRLAGIRIDADEAYQIEQDARLGCPLCIKDGESCNHSRVIGEGQIPAETADFRNFDELPLRGPVQFVKDIRDGVITILSCSCEVVFALQDQFEIFAECIRDIGFGFYELVFPQTMEDRLKEVGLIQ